MSGKAGRVCRVRGGRGKGCDLVARLSQERRGQLWAGARPAWEILTVKGFPGASALPGRASPSVSLTQTPRASRPCLVPLDVS